MMNKYKRVEKVVNAISNKAHAVSTTGYKGVTSDKRPGRKPFASYFQVRYNNQSVKIALGYYDTAEAAYIARLKFIDSLK